MKRGSQTFVILALLVIVASVIALVPNASAAVADCTFSAVPCAAQFINVGNVSSDGHFLNNSNEPNRLCCKDVAVGGGVASFKYSADGHVSVNASITNFSNGMYLGFQESCSLKQNCAAGNEICIFKVTNTSVFRAENSHVYDCSDATAGKEKLCCRFTELCSDGIDNDFDGLIDCADPDCNGIVTSTPSVCTGSPYNSSTCVTLNRDPNPPYTKTIINNTLCNSSDGNQYYCSYPADGTPTGVCCISGKVAQKDIFGNWQCVDSEPCGLTSLDPSRSCAYDFDSSKDSWMSSAYDGGAKWCVSRMPDLYNPDGPVNDRSTGCCFMVKDGQVDYFTDIGNVKIFGTS